MAGLAFGSAPWRPYDRPPSAGVRLFGNLYTPAQQDLPDLRREQAAFAEVRRAEAARNAWMAVPALAPAGIIFALEAGALLGLGRSAAAAGGGPLVLEGEAVVAPQAAATEGLLARVGRPTVRQADDVLRGPARKVYQRAYGTPAAKMEAEVHHRVPIQFAGVFPRANPNRVANLQALEPRAHAMMTRAQDAFSRSLGGRQPTQAEVMRFVLKADKLAEKNIIRPGSPRPRMPSPKPRPPKHE